MCFWHFQLPSRLQKLRKTQRNTACSNSNTIRGIRSHQGTVDRWKNSKPEWCTFTQLDWRRCTWINNCFDAALRRKMVTNTNCRTVRLRKLRFFPYFSLSFIDAFSFISKIIGSSTGGILGLCVGKGLSMKTCMLFYLQLKDEAFKGGRPYAAGPLEKWLKRIYGENATMNSIKKPKIMVTATKNDKKPMDLALFRNYESSSEILGFQSNTGDKLLWKVGLSTGKIEWPRRRSVLISAHLSPHNSSLQKFNNF